MLIDTHCHLDAAPFDPDRDAMLARARSVGVSLLVVPAVERANFGAISALCRECPECRAAYGIHPMCVDRAQEDDLDALRQTLARERALAVGEIGLDRFVEPRNDDRQTHFFVEQLKIAREAGLPVILHSRRAMDMVLKHLRSVPIVGGIAHAFNGSRQQAEEFIKQGFKLGFGGAMTYPRALHIRELAATLPLQALVLETDAPDMSPEWLKSGRNEPAELAKIAATLAELRQISVAEVLEATSYNARQALPGLSLVP